MSHPVKKITIKEADVDCEIIPVVQWLNNQGDIYTRHSCQGDEPPPTVWDKPMVVFYCESNATLAMILHKIETCGEIQVEWYESAGSLRYILRFNDRDSLDRFKKTLKETNNV